MHVLIRSPLLCEYTQPLLLTRILSPQRLPSFPIYNITFIHHADNTPKKLIKQPFSPTSHQAPPTNPPVIKAAKFSASRKRTLKTCSPIDSINHSQCVCSAPSRVPCRPPRRSLDFHFDRLLRRSPMELRRAEEGKRNGTTADKRNYFCNFDGRDGRGEDRSSRGVGRALRQPPPPRSRNYFFSPVGERRTPRAVGDLSPSCRGRLTRPSLIYRAKLHGSVEITNRSRGRLSRAEFPVT